MNSRTAGQARWGELGLNTEPPRIMHIDLNSAFAMAEQQARPNLRGRPLGMTNRLSKNCCVIAASYEAKSRGVKVGMGLMEARSLVPELIIMETDPPKYHYIYQKLATIMKHYSPEVVMKSIDEGVLDFHGMGLVHKQPLEEIGREIKQRLRWELGSWLKVNIGIGPNRFLAKTAAGLNKPDGLDKIDHRNLLDVYGRLELMDLTGIGPRYAARLSAYGIYSPLDFLATPADKLRRLVFRSVVGDDWYQRLRGYEVDKVTTKLGQVGRQFALDVQTNDEEVLLPRFHYLCDTVGKKLRFQAVDARGILVWARFKNGQGWRQRRMFPSSFYTDKEIYQRAAELFAQRPKHLKVVIMGITCYQLTPTVRGQLGIIEETNRQERLTAAIDDINECYGVSAIGPLESLRGKTVKQKIPFGGTRYFELLLKRA